MEDKLQNPFDLLNERLKRIENLLSALLLKNQTDLANQPTKDKRIAIAIEITGLKRKTVSLIPHSKRGKRLYFDETELIEMDF